MFIDRGPLVNVEVQFAKVSINRRSGVKSIMFYVSSVNDIICPMCIPIHLQMSWFNDSILDSISLHFSKLSVNQTLVEFADYQLSDVCFFPVLLMIHDFLVGSGQGGGGCGFGSTHFVGLLLVWEHWVFCVSLLLQEHCGIFDTHKKTSPILCTVRHVEYHTDTCHTVCNKSEFLIFQ